MLVGGTAVAGAVYHTRAGAVYHTRGQYATGKAARAQLGKDLEGGGAVDFLGCQNLEGGAQLIF